MHGSARLAQALHAAGLIDEYRLLVFPVTVGAGKRLFTGNAPPRGYTLLESRTTRAGAVYQVLTPKAFEAGGLTVLMISHKFHEVTAFADEITVLRKGKLTGTGKVADLDRKAMAQMMIGDQPIAALDSRAPVPADAGPILTVKGVKAPDRTGLKWIRVDGLDEPNSDASQPARDDECVDVRPGSAPEAGLRVSSRQRKEAMS